MPEVKELKKYTLKGLDVEQFSPTFPPLVKKKQQATGKN